MPTETDNQCYASVHNTTVETVVGATVEEW